MIDKCQFEEYVTAALASVRYREFLSKGKGNGTIIAGTGRLVYCKCALETHIISGGDTHTLEDFSTIWITEFTKTNAYEVWDRSTDPMLFDIVEPRSVCDSETRGYSPTDLSLDTLVTRNRRWCQI